MKVHIIDLYGFSVEDRSRIHRTARVGAGLGLLSMGLYAFDDRSDSDRDLSRRMDGIIASIEPGDAVIFQYPTWISDRYERTLLKKLKAYGARVILLVHELPSACRSNAETMEKLISLFSLADLVVVPTGTMRDLLVSEGLSVREILAYEWYDCPVGGELETPKLLRRLLCAQPLSACCFAGDWRFTTPLVLHGTAAPVPAGTKLLFDGARSELAHIHELNRGGFGLLWSGGAGREPDNLIIPEAASLLLAAGVPVLIQRGHPCTAFFLRNGIGLEIETLEEADAHAQTMGEDEYRALAERCASLSALVRNGYFMRKLLIDTLMRVQCVLPISAEECRRMMPLV